MNTGQMMLSGLAVALLGTTILSVNRNSINSSTILRQTELGIYAVSVATSYIQKAKSMAFDEKTTPGLAITLPMVSPPAGSLSTIMGPSNPRFFMPTGGTMEAVESNNFDNTYDDFGDYNGFLKDTSIGNVGNFHITAVVYYVSQTAPYGKVAGPTWLKQIVIKVNSNIDRSAFTDQSGVDTITLSYIKSFYF